MTARTIAGCAMIPITVLKTRFESGHFNYTKMSSALIDIYSHEGLRGLSCGLVPTLARDAPYSGIRKIDFTKFSGKKNYLCCNFTKFLGKKINRAAISRFFFNFRTLSDVLHTAEATCKKQFIFL